MNITFPTLIAEFGANASTVQWTITVYLLIVTSVVPLLACLKHSFKTRSIFLTANLLSILDVLVDAIAPDFAILLFGRVVQGIGVGTILLLMFGITLDQVPMSKTDTMMGMGTLITTVAPVVGPTSGGSVASSLDWRFVSVLLIPLLLVSLVSSVTSIEQKDEAVYEKSDILSVIVVLCAFIGLILGINNLADYDFLSLPVLDSLFVDIAGLIVLVKRPAQLAVPIAELSVLRNGKSIGHVVTFFLFQVVNLGLLFLIPNYVQLANHSTSMVAGLLVFPGAFIGACFTPFSGSILDRLGAKEPIIFGASILVFTLCLYSIFDLHLSNVWLTIFYILSMGRAEIAFGSVMTSGQKQVALKEHADTSTIFNALQQFAGAVGTTIISLIVALNQTNSSLSYSAATTQGSRNASIVLLILATIELVILLRVVDGKEE